MLAPQTLRYVRRTSVAVATAALVMAASCSSTESGTASPPTTSAASTTGPSTSADASTNAFSIPASRLEEVAAAGLTYTEIDYPTQPDGVPWPTSAWQKGELPDDVDASAVQEMVDSAFGELSDDSGTIDAILVVKGGELVVEEYNGWDPNATHNSWSVAKSINSALVGILVGEGRLDVWQPVGAPEWSEPDDPRAAITLDQLMRMSSGLQWGEDYDDPDGDVLTTLGSELDRAHYVADKPLEFEPGTEWFYSTGTANLIARSVADQVGRGDELVGWIDNALFAPLGITQVEHKLDAEGVISGGSWINLTPQDFARFGLLYARGGVWDGEQLLPAGWVDYSRMPTPSNPLGTYGAQWWLDPERPGMFYASGFNGQSINVVPQKDLVVVVVSSAGDGRDDAIRNGLLDAFGA